MSHITLHPSKNRLAYFLYQNQQLLIFFRETGIRESILKRGFQQLDKKLSHHSKVTVILLQLHQKHWTSNNRNITQFINGMKKLVKQQYGCELGYLWVREQNQSEAQHYHIAIMVNGHRCQGSYRIDEWAKQLWHDQTAGNFSYKVRNRVYRIETCKNNNELRAARLRLSYMAKNDTKPTQPNLKCFGGSRIRDP